MVVVGATVVGILVVASTLFADSILIVSPVVRTNDVFTGATVCESIHHGDYVQFVLVSTCFSRSGRADRRLQRPVARCQKSKLLLASHCHSSIQSDDDDSDGCCLSLASLCRSSRPSKVVIRKAACRTMRPSHLAAQTTNERAVPRRAERKPMMPKLAPNFPWSGSPGWG